MRTFFHEPRAHRLIRERAQRWTGWHIWAVDVQEAPDELVRVVVHCDNLANPAPSAGRSFEFMTDAAGKRQSARLDAFMRACGIKERVDDTREMEGRYFATLNDGRTANDFGSLTNAMVR